MTDPRFVILMLFYLWLTVAPVLMTMGLIDFSAWRRQRAIDRVYGKRRGRDG